MTDEVKGKSVLEALSIKRFGGRTFPIEAVTSVSTTRINLLRNNPNRLHYVLINEGGFDVRVSNSADITASSGWLLAANGGIISMDWEIDGEAVGYSLYAIASGGASNVRHREVTIV